MVELSKIKKGERAADLGSGDGRISIAFAKTGAIVDSFELDEKLISVANKNSLSEKVNENITIHKKDFWVEDLSRYSVIAIYPMPDIMLLLEEKLDKELKSGTKVVVNFYPLPNWKYKTFKNNIYLYIK